MLPKAKLTTTLRNQVIVFGLTWCAYAAANLIRKPVSVGKAAIGAELGLSIPQLGWLDTASLLPYAICQVYAGILGDIYGARLLLLVGLTLASSTVIAVSFQHGFWSILILLVLCGVGQSFVWPACAKALAPWFSPSTRDTVFGVWGTCQSAGGLLGTVISSALIEAWGWRSAFLAPSLLVLTTGWANFVFLKTPQEAGVPAPNQVAGPVNEPAPIPLTTLSQSKRLDPEATDGVGALAPSLGLKTNGIHPSGAAVTSVATSTILHMEGEVANDDTDSHSENETGGLVSYTGAVNRASASGFSGASSITSSSPFPASQRPHTPPPKSDKMTLLEAFSIPSMPQVTISFLLLKLTRYVFILWLPMYFTQQGFPINVAGVLSVCFEIGNAVGTATNGFAITHLFNGRKVKMVAAYTVVLVVCILAFISSAKMTAKTMGASPGTASSSSPSSDPSAHPTARISPPVSPPMSAAIVSGVIMFLAGFFEPGFVITGPIATELGEYGGRNSQAALAGMSPSRFSSRRLIALCFDICSTLLLSLSSL